jgi:uncharacterized repeat protein (TIGR03803 family)
MQRLASTLCIIILAGCAQPPATSSLPATSQARKATSSNFQILYTFATPRNGIIPAGSLLVAGSTLYGTTNFGGGASKSCYPGNGCGTVFQFTASNDYSDLFRFKGLATGTRPYSGMIDVNGTLYGTTQTGGKRNEGTVFSLTTSGSLHVIHSFRGKDGNDPRANLTSVNGALYGTTYYGGSAGTGAIFTITGTGTGTGTEKVLHNFKSGKDGALPLCALIEVNGVLYGTTASGGTGNAGTVFEINPDGTNYRVIYSFQGGTDGAFPYSGLTALNGTLYGTTDQGGTYNKGTVFAVTPSGSEQVLHSFGHGTDGAYPYAGLTVLNGELYGTTAYGGTTPGADRVKPAKPSSEGTLFTITPYGSEQVLHDFTGGPGGRVPYADLVVMNGVLYGTTIWGGNTKQKRGGTGTLFVFTP